MIEKFKKRTVTEYIAMAGMVIVGILLLILSINWSVDLGRGIRFFTDGKGNELKGYEITVLLFFYIASILLFVLAFYEAFLKAPHGPYEQTKELLDGEVTDIKKMESRFEKKNDSSKDNKEAK